MNFYHIIAYFVNLKGKRVRKEQSIFGGWIAHPTGLLSGFEGFFCRFKGNLNAWVNFQCLFTLWFMILDRVFR